ncbi:MAG: XdhC/CoxI family protein [Spirochaetota bacterium]
MKRLFSEMVDLLSAGESFVTATIFDKAGSAPRTAGAKMIIRKDGSISGTVGGGELEAEARLLARQVFDSKIPLTRKFNLNGNSAGVMHMVCGGTGEFFIDYLNAANPDNLAIYRNIINALENREKAWLITGLGNTSKNHGMRQQCLIKQDKTLVGKFECDPEFLNKLILGPAKISIHSEVLNDQRVLVEPIRHSGTLYLFGAGHVSQKTALIAESVGFKTVVMDDRADYANEERFPTADVMVLSSFEKLPDLQIDSDSYIVIVTRGHLHDKIILGQMLPKPAAYIGMIGSRTKRAAVYRELSEEQGFTDNDFARVFSPIGLDIMAETPEEIAISIVAELIKVRAARERSIEVPKISVKDSAIKYC